MYNYQYLFSYVPVRYNPEGTQKENNQEVYRFKEGNASERVINLLAEKIKGIVGVDKSNWVIAFIPASTSAKTQRRYGRVAKELSARTGISVAESAIYNKEDRESTMVTGKTRNPTETFGVKNEQIRGKKVLLIDDVITRGVSFNQMAGKLKMAGAVDITGLFLAKTVSYSNSSFAEPEPWELEGMDFDPEHFIEPEPCLPEDFDVPEYDDFDDFY